MRILFFFLSFVLVSRGFAVQEYLPKQQIGVQNAILAKVNGTTISMMDVKKKMDLIFYQNFPQFADSEMARLQFYEGSWKKVLQDLIDHELILADATDKEVKLSDGDIRAAMEERFAPSITQTLDQIGLTYEEAWKMIKNELLAQRMSYWFIHSKARTRVTPQDIRQSYRLYVAENPPFSDWKYHVISLRISEPNQMLVDSLFEALSEKNQSPSELQSLIASFEKPGVSINVSQELSMKSQDLSEAHKRALENLSPGTYSKPSFQTSRHDQKKIYRIFYLISKEEHPAPPFESVAQHLKDELTQKMVVEESENYLRKLRKHYGFEGIQASLEEMHPFSLQ